MMAVWAKGLQTGIRKRLRILAAKTILVIFYYTGEW
jgi:hypothetical protein